ncbi:MAG: ATP-dependent endonuclease [Actinobacteria bacterium]|nr:ATP-dependent endonuclease [Actinomycetota bacterium]
MRIARIEISNFRSIKHIAIHVEPYTALIGTNGAGKSAVLYALDWFFRGGPLEVSDVHRSVDAKSGETIEPAAETVVEVAVIFTDLSPRDRERLERYGRGDDATFKRSWSLSAEKDKIVGNALQGPGFADIRVMSKVGEFRPAYKTLRATMPELPDLGVSPSKDQVVDALVDWENDTVNSAKLISLDADDASHMFGFTGSSVIRQCVQMVLVPAATDISDQVNGVGKGSTLNDLIGTLMNTATTKAKAEWKEKHSDAIAELATSMSTSVLNSAGLQSDRVNDKLKSLVPNSLVEFTATVPDWTPTPSAIVRTDVTIDGLRNDVSRQGHGVQRAVLIAMLHALVPDEALVKAGHEPLEGEDEDEAAERLKAALSDLPHTLICIEEPEIYQHPIRARAFARVLSELSNSQNVQIIMATHSPYFTRPEQFGGVRRFCLSGCETLTCAASLSDVAKVAKCSEDQVEKIVQKRLPTTFAEGFFADAAVLLEGDTDVAVLTAIAEKMGKPFDTVGVCLIDVSGKTAIAVPHAIMTQLGVPVYVVCDSDYLNAELKYPQSQDAEKPNNKTNREMAHGSHQSATEKVVSWLSDDAAVSGNVPYGFGDPSVTSGRYTIWNNDIESELQSWPSFIAALASGGFSLRCKNVLAYRAAVIDAELDDMPASLGAAVDAIGSFFNASISKSKVAAPDLLAQVSKEAEEV